MAVHEVDIVTPDISREIQVEPVDAFSRVFVALVEVQHSKAEVLDVRPFDGK